MKLNVIYLSEDFPEYRDGISIKLETNSEKSHLKFLDGEPEDNSLSRNFNDVYSIPDLLIQAYEAGKSGEELRLSNITVDSINEF